jgi:chaperone modulatory protein CbpM
METEYLIPLEEFCTSHEIEISFVTSLQESGLVEITTIKEAGFIEAAQLPQLEKFIRLYYDLDINLEGIETINYLLQRINAMQAEITRLKNKLRIYDQF